MKNAKWKLVVAVVAVLALSAPAAVGVYRALEATRGWGAASLAALGIELAYLSLALLTLSPELRAHARAVALSAVGSSIVLNVLADYAARVPGGLSSWDTAAARFDGLALGLAVVESAPLAGLAFALASLLHRLAEADAAPETSGDAEEPAEGVTARNAPKLYSCRRCGAEGFTFAELGQHSRACDGQQLAPTGD